MKDKFEKYLPIGSVVLLENALKKVMITGYAITNDEDNKIYDYMGCLWPEGVISSDRNILFDHEKIEKIFAVGYSNEETKTFMDLMKRALDVRKKELEEQELYEKSDTNINEESKDEA